MAIFAFNRNGFCNDATDFFIPHLGGVRGVTLPLYFLYFAFSSLSDEMHFHMYFVSLLLNYGP